VDETTPEYQNFLTSSSQSSIYRNDCVLFKCSCPNTYKESSNLFTNKPLSKGFPLEGGTYLG